MYYLWGFNNQVGGYVAFCVAVTNCVRAYCLHLVDGWVGGWGGVMNDVMNEYVRYVIVCIW